MAVFTKPPIPPSEQLNCLKDRGLIIQDNTRAKVIFLLKPRRPYSIVLQTLSLDSQFY